MTEPIKVVADILQTELGLTNGHVLLSYQQFKLPSDSGLYIILNNISGKAIGNNNYFDSTLIGMQETQQVAMHEIVQIDLMSADNSARTRKIEVIAALMSKYSQQQQEINTVKIGRIPSEFSDTSSLEETQFLYRFTMTIPIFSLYTKTKIIADYYDNFTQEVYYNE